MAMRAVLDTNVTVSALIWGGTPLRLLEVATE
jgi:predicted nucleic acid-binding protein